MDITSILPVFLITLREGVEASLVVGIVMACLAKANKTDLFPSVYGGIAAGIGVSLVLGWLLQYGLSMVGLSSWHYGAVAEQFLKGLVAVSAVGLLSWMLIWMTQQARGLKGEIEASVKSSVAATGIFSLVFIDVLREGVETALFIGSQGGIAFIGAVAGTLTAVGIGLLVFRGGIKINLRQFFQVMGVVLLLIVAGLVVTALKKFEAGFVALAQIEPSWHSWCTGKDSCILGFQVWDLTPILPDRVLPGLLLKTLLGYTQKLYFVQAIAYILFLTGVGGLYWRSINLPK